MVEKDTILKEKIWFVGIANFKETYEYAYDFFIDEDYFITEEKYKEVFKGDSKDVEITWKAQKQITDYFKITVELKWKILGMEDVEVEINGKKKKMQKLGELSINIKGVLEKDYNNKWGLSGFNKFLKEMYNKFIIPGRTEELEGKTADIVKDFKREIKAHLDMTGKR